ncbi:hypothetical protein O9X98_06210 [Agrobacterium salinitolerans]|nr:hypothetical protein [Agrobacterium salinitolerans]
MPIILEEAPISATEKAYEILAMKTGFYDQGASFEHLGPFSYAKLAPEDFLAEDFRLASETWLFPFKAGNRFPQLLLRRGSHKFHAAYGNHWYNKHLYDYVIAAMSSEDASPKTVTFFTIPTVLISGLCVTNVETKTVNFHALCRLIDKQSGFEDFSFSEFSALVADHHSFLKRTEAIPVEPTSS